MQSALKANKYQIIKRNGNKCENKIIIVGFEDSGFQDWIQLRYRVRDNGTPPKKLFHSPGIALYPINVLGVQLYGAHQIEKCSYEL
jgi:hypothetical protein